MLETVFVLCFEVDDRAPLELMRLVLRRTFTALFFGRAETCEELSITEATLATSTLAIIDCGVWSLLASFGLN